VARLAVNSLESENPREIPLKLLHSVDPLKNRDTKDRGTLYLKVSVHIISVYIIFMSLLLSSFRFQRTCDSEIHLHCMYMQLGIS
jgi:hypothetical protein